MTRPTRGFLHGSAFFLTGVGTALLGATLPATLHQWHLSDSQGGLLLLASWGGSTVGALFARRQLDRSAALGLALSSFGLFALAQLSTTGLMLLYFFYGLGLGTTMTAISLLRSRNACPQEADLELNRLNLLWAAGACASPVLALHSLRLLSVATLYRSVGAVFALFANFLFLVTDPRAPSTPSAPRAAAVPTLPWAPLRFGLFAAACVGLESAVGSWLTTYAERSTAGLNTAVSANAAFWLGLLLSRALHSVKAIGWLHTQSTRNLHIAAVVVAIVSLIAVPGSATTPLAGLVCGFGLGPLYPYVLSVTLPRYRSVMVFVLAGVGASVVPWLTGVVSTAGDSLRLGLLVPATACLALIASTWAIQVRGPEQATASVPGAA